MREIKFRGYATGIGWVYGSLINNLWTYSEISEQEKGSPCYEIITGKYDGDCWQDIAEQEGEAIISVIPKSVGEFTGLTDKNNKEVFEGDIIQCYYGGDKHGAIEAVEFQNGAFILRHRACPISKYLENDGVYSSDIEVIGNMTETPELKI